MLRVKPELKPGDDWLHIKTIDMHTGGEPLRIIYDGLPEISGKTILEKRQYFKNNLDHIRTGVIFEPRGHADMYGAVIVEPERSDSDFGVIFLHNEGYSTMCGHAVIALAKFAFEMGLITKGQKELKIDVPAGQVFARLNFEKNTLYSTSFRNVPSFVFAHNQQLTISEIGKITFDIAYGGAFYAICKAEDFGIIIEPGSYQQIIHTGKIIKSQITQSIQVEHPFQDELSFLYGVIFTAPSEKSGVYSKNACIFAEGELDRSATGSGVSARAALLYKENKIKIGENITIESIIGSNMQVCVTETLKYGPYDAVIPEVTGMAFFTGNHDFYFEPTDPLKKGFILR